MNDLKQVSDCFTTGLLLSEQRYRDNMYFL